MERRKKINQCTLEELNERLEKLQQHDKTFNSDYAKHLLERINFLKNVKQ